MALFLIKTYHKETTLYRYKPKYKANKHEHQAIIEQDQHCRHFHCKLTLTDYLSVNYTKI